MFTLIGLALAAYISSVVAAILPGIFRRASDAHGEVAITSRQEL
jgi:hypothetical protein